MRTIPGDPAASESGGMLPVDKPVGPTSHDVVARARRSMDERRIGHTGTLDPFASGLLLLLIGPATRLSEYLTGLDKVYEATALLGVSTDTLDPEGAVVGEDDAWRELDEADVRGALASFRGRSLQVPPAYSAKKIAGEAAHRRVRRGEEVVLEPVSVEIHEVELTAADLPLVRFRLRCSSGTYVRAIARDLGRSLGTGAHLTALRRTAVGPFDVGGALPLSALDPEAASAAGGERAVAPEVAAAWVPAARALPHLATLRVGEEGEADLRHGRPVPIPPPGDGATSSASPPGKDAPVALVREGRLLAVGERRGDAVQPRKVFVGV